MRWVGDSLESRTLESEEGENPTEYRPLEAVYAVNFLAAPALSAKWIEINFHPGLAGHRAVANQRAAYEGEIRNWLIETMPPAYAEAVAEACLLQADAAEKSTDSASSAQRRDGYDVQVLPRDRAEIYRSAASDCREAAARARAKSLSVSPPPIAPPIVPPVAPPVAPIEAGTGVLPTLVFPGASPESIEARESAAAERRATQQLITDSVIQAIGRSISSTAGMSGAADEDWAQAILAERAVAGSSDWLTQGADILLAGANQTPMTRTIDQSVRSFIDRLFPPSIDESGFSAGSFLRRAASDFAAEWTIDEAYRRSVELGAQMGADTESDAFARTWSAAHPRHLAFGLKRYKEGVVDYFSEDFARTDLARFLGFKPKEDR